MPRQQKAAWAELTCVGAAHKHPLLFLCRGGLTRSCFHRAVRRGAARVSMPPLGSGGAEPTERTACPLEPHACM